MDPSSVAQRIRQNNSAKFARELSITEVDALPKEERDILTAKVTFVSQSNRGINENCKRAAKSYNCLCTGDALVNLKCKKCNVKINKNNYILFF
jgi:hypothetical protein